MENIVIRSATVKDAEALLNIYAYYVKNTAITFEYDVPTLLAVYATPYDTALAWIPDKPPVLLR
ncbi:MAG: GNAT family N-acetyltransferase [Firmicutes bacterium]|nr:GNAT family N-acetyltransferase [Bacillota bacterium]